MSLEAHYLEDVLVEFTRYKSLADRALAQVSAEALFVTLDRESNSLAVIMKHVAGNLRSRWTDFLATDGEKPDRHRDREFEIGEGDTKEALFQAWERGWACLFDTLRGLQPADLLKEVSIRGEPHTVVQAIDRALGHAAYHSGQIVYLARHLSHDRWQPLTIPRGKSEEFNVRMRGKPAGS